MLRGADQCLIGIIIAEIDVGFLLDDRVVPAVVDPEGNERHIEAGNSTCCNGGVLRLEIRGKFRTVMSSIRLGEDAEVTILVLRELGVESLKEFPHIRSSSHGGSNRIGSI